MRRPTKYSRGTSFLLILMITGGIVGACAYRQIREVQRTDHLRLVALEAEVELMVEEQVAKELHSHH